MPDAGTNHLRTEANFLQSMDRAKKKWGAMVTGFEMPKKLSIAIVQ